MIESQNQKSDDSTQFIQRDPTKFREFCRSKALGERIREDPYSHFFLKEAGKIEKVHKAYEDIEEQFKVEDPKLHKQQDKIKDKLYDKLEEILFKN